MKNLIKAIALSLLLATPVLARDFAQVKVTEESLHSAKLDGHVLLLKAFDLMSRHYQEAFSPLVTDYPIEVVFLDTYMSWFGCYGAACFEVGDYDAFYGDPKFIYQNKVYVNLDAIALSVSDDEFEAFVILVLAHELGHHALTLTGISIWEQHKLMYCGPDPKMLKELKLNFSVSNRCV